MQSLKKIHAWAQMKVSLLSLWLIHTGTFGFATSTGVLVKLNKSQDSQRSKFDKILVCEVKQELV